MNDDLLAPAHALLSHGHGAGYGLQAPRHELHGLRRQGPIRDEPLQVGYEARDGARDLVASGARLADLPEEDAVGAYLGWVVHWGPSVVGEEVSFGRRYLRCVAEWGMMKIMFEF